MEDFDIRIKREVEIRDFYQGQLFKIIRDLDLFSYNPAHKTTFKKLNEMSEEVEEQEEIIT